MPESERYPPGSKDWSTLGILCSGVSEWSSNASTGALEDVDAVTFIGAEMPGSPSERADGCITLRAILVSRCSQ